jgi:hypothetical protein
MQILRRGHNDLRIVTKIPDAHIAVVAEQAADHPVAASWSMCLLGAR